MTDNSRLKQLLKYIFVVVLYYTGCMAVISYFRRAFFGGGKYIILMYHRVLDRDAEEIKYLQPGMYVSKEVFEKQIAFLSGRFRPVGLSELAGFIAGGQRIPDISVVITFDDGWRDNYENAFPILKKYKTPATIFLTSDCIGTEKEFWFLRASRLVTDIEISRDEMGKLIGKQAEVKQEEADPGLSDRDWFIEKLKKLSSQEINALLDDLEAHAESNSKDIKPARSMLTWEEVDEMNRNGIEFGSHGCSHKILTGLTKDEMEREITESKRVIENKLGKEINLFAYPNGDYNDKVKSIVKNSGYICALATGGIRDDSGGDIFSLRRINVHDGVSVGPRGNFSRAMFSFHIFRNS